GRLREEVFKSRIFRVFGQSLIKEPKSTIDTIVKEVASQFSLTENELQREGIKAFLQDKLHLLEVERQHIFRKFDVLSFEDLDRYVTEHPDKESDLLEDFERADYFTLRIEEIRKLFKRLNCSYEK
ncbi:MAG: hypothetical protein ACE5I1_33430, partial [bacterium]